MKIWHLDCEVDKFENLTWVEKLNLEEINSFDGRKKADNWIPFAVKRMYDREFSNTLGLTSNIPVFDKRTVGIVSDLLDGYAEVLPLECLECEVYAINVTEVLNCIDYDNSEVKTYRDGKRIMRFIKYAFIEDLVSGKHIFRIVDEPLRRPFVSDDFKQRVIDNNLTGFIFELVWDSEV